MDYNRPRRRVEKTSWHLPPAGPPAVTGAGPRPPPGRGSLRRLDTSTLPRRIQSKGGPRPVKLTHDLSTGASGIKGSNLPEGQQIQSVRKILASGDRENGEKSIGCWGGGRGGQGEGFRRGRALPLSASSASSAPRGAGGCAAGGDRRVPAREAEGRRHATGHAGTSVPLHAGARGGLPQPAEAQPHSPRPRHQEGSPLRLLPLLPAFFLHQLIPPCAFSRTAQEFDASYGPAWHCVVGRSFGSYLTHSPGGFVYFSLDGGDDADLSLLLFQTHLRRLQPLRSGGPPPPPPPPRRS